MIYQFINFVILAAILVWALRSKLSTAFAAQKAEIERNVKEAESQYREVRSKFEEITAKINSFREEAAALKASHEQALRYESDRIKQAAEAAIRRYSDDAEFRVKVATEKAKRGLEKDLLETSLLKARENLSSSLDAKDAAWTSRMIQAEEGLKTGKANYAS